MNKTKDPKYCRFHRFIGHHTEDCYVLKNRIQQMIDDSLISVDKDDKGKAAVANSITAAPAYIQVQLPFALTPESIPLPVFSDHEDDNEDSWD